ncbi:hypothetical protein DM01DRAFT_1337796 [Hesseltinella vesiculosa]|uniref:Uncharacterized protein n=1 Tax=Hesseltinella vesiculosa TaxID=101127 RepID=A0A1X2GBR6_9FUNG|nr:hypothetical protein DM01DRAFT_1337796 [Hesseltinella vesiculosa]
MAYRNIRRPRAPHGALSLGRCRWVHDGGRDAQLGNLCHHGNFTRLPGHQVVYDTLANSLKKDFFFLAKVTLARSLDMACLSLAFAWHFTSQSLHDARHRQPSKKLVEESGRHLLMVTTLFFLAFSLLVAGQRTGIYMFWEWLC